MTKIKLCGLRREEDVACVNGLLPDYIGYVFVKSSKRYIAPEDAGRLSGLLDSRIIPVGVFMDAEPTEVASMVERNIIKAVQLHGREDNDYIRKLREIAGCTVIKAFRIGNAEDVEKASQSIADYVLLDSDGGSGKTFDWSLLKRINRPYFLAGGLSAENVGSAIKELAPFGVDASSSLETNGYKDKIKMEAFVKAVREEENYE